AVDVLARAEVAERERVPDIRRGNEPRRLRREGRGSRRRAGAGGRGRRVRDLPVDDADGDQTVLRRSLAAERLPEEHGMSVTADHWRVVEKLEVGDALAR